MLADAQPGMFSSIGGVSDDGIEIGRLITAFRKVSLSLSSTVHVPVVSPLPVDPSDLEKVELSPKVLLTATNRKLRLGAQSLVLSVCRCSDSVL